MIQFLIRLARTRIPLSLAALILLSGMGAPAVKASTPNEVPDWPHFRGPDRTGISQDKDWLGAWPDDGPKVLWRASVGTGFSSMSICDGLLYTMGNTATSNREENQRDVVFCFDAKTGALKWNFEYPCPLGARNFEGGPTATPTVEGSAVYTFSKVGHAHRLDAKTGKAAWRRNLQEEEGLKPPTWGFSGSVTILGDLAIFNAGSAGIALDKKTGKTVWKSGGEGAGYSTPLPVERGGGTEVLIFGARKLLSLDPRSGKTLWEIPWKTSYDVNASEPIPMKDAIFISTGYKRGCGLFELKGNGPKEVYQNDAMSNQVNSSVLYENFLYGFSGNVGGRGILTCMDPRTGETKWSHKGLGTGSLMLADGKLIVLGEKGQLVIAEAVPDGYRVLREAEILSGKCWTVPVLWNGKIYARNAAGDLVCVDAKSAGGAPVEGSR
jgi:outer membrane protein assembly factor BamB